MAFAVNVYFRSLHCLYIGALLDRTSKVGHQPILRFKEKFHLKFLVRNCMQPTIPIPLRRVLHYSAFWERTLPSLHHSIVVVSIRSIQIKHFLIGKYNSSPLSFPCNVVFANWRSPAMHDAVGTNKVLRVSYHSKYDSFWSLYLCFVFDFSERKWRIEGFMKDLPILCFSDKGSNYRQLTYFCQFSPKYNGNSALRLYMHWILLFDGVSVLPRYRFS